MLNYRRIFVICVVMICPAILWGAPAILNEYNAVSSTEYLNGGTAAADEDGGRASDIYFGRVPGNGGDWFELVVVTDHLDMRNWRLDIFENGALDKTLDLTNHSIWSDLRSGTIITVSENVPSDISYDPAAGDWWINVQANDNADGKYIEASNFVVSSTNWQLRIRNAAGAVVFGPAGEGISPQTGIASTEIFRLEAEPSATITPTSTKYDSGKDFSTFGAPNRWGVQDFSQLRTVAAAASSITVLSPNDSEVIAAGTIYTITWNHEGTIPTVLVEFSVEDGLTWSAVYPPNVGNTGQYSWLVPMVDSSHCLIRVSSATQPGVADVSNGVFSIYQCGVSGDLTGDCIVDMLDLAVMASDWLQCGNPNDPACQ